jgi:hypothetical protein
VAQRAIASQDPLEANTYLAVKRDLLSNVGNTGPFIRKAAVTKKARLTGSHAIAHLPGPQVRVCPTMKAAASDRFASHGTAAAPTATMMPSSTRTTVTRTVSTLASFSGILAKNVPQDINPDRPQSLAPIA